MKYTKISLLRFLQFILLFISGYCISQEIPAEVQGNWLTFKIESGDGKSAPRTFAYNSTIPFSFGKTAMNKGNFVQFDRYSLPVTVSGNKISISPKHAFFVEKVVKDTLIISEIVEGSPPEEQVRYHLLRLDRIVDEIERPFIGKDTLVASRYLTPYERKYSQGEITQLYKNFRESFYVEGKIFINTELQSVNTVITKSTSGSKKTDKQLIEHFNSSYSNWYIDPARKYKVFEISFRHVVEVKGALMSAMFSFLPSENYEPDEHKKNNPVAASKFFTRGVDEYNKKNYKDAVAYFEKSFAADNRNKDSLYNIGAIQFELKNIPECCKVWQRLADIGEAAAAELLAEHCK